MNEDSRTCEIQGAEQVKEKHRPSNRTGEDRKRVTAAHAPNMQLPLRSRFQAPKNAIHKTARTFRGADQERM